MLFIKRQADCFHSVGLRLYYAIDRSAATAAAAVDAATTVVAAAIVVVATAAEKYDDENNDPQTGISTSTAVSKHIL